MTPIRSCYAYCGAVCAQVRFKPDHAAITEELSGHILDRRDALMEQGLSRQEAEAQAVAAMGDPNELAVVRYAGPNLSVAHIPTAQTSLS